MVDLVIWAIPAFVVLLVAEAWSFRHAHDHDHAHGHDHDHDLIGYDTRDTATSMTMGLGNLVINVGWKAVVVVVLAAVHELAPVDLPDGAWWAWVLLFLADDLAFYWYHRTHHEVRVCWASHVVHHSSEHYNLSTALRQPWVPFTALPFWMPLALAGFEPWQILLAQSWSLIFQFGLHTERIGRLPRPVEAVFNTPSHHRVNHGSNAEYLDRDHGGILIVWDRLFRSFVPESERVRYGLTKNIETFNPVKVAFGEYGALIRDVRAARGWRTRLQIALRGPAWLPPDVDDLEVAPAQHVQRV